MRTSWRGSRRFWSRGRGDVSTGCSGRRSKRRNVTPSPRSPQRGMALAAYAAMALTAACGPEDDPEETFVALHPSAETTAPLSESNGIAVTPEGIACVIDSYEIRIYCADRNGRTVAYFGERETAPASSSVSPRSIGHRTEGSWSWTWSAVAFCGFAQRGNCCRNRRLRLPSYLPGASPVRCLARRWLPTRTLRSTSLLETSRGADGIRVPMAWTRRHA